MVDNCGRHSGCPQWRSDGETLPGNLHSYDPDSIRGDGNRFRHKANDPAMVANDLRDTAHAIDPAFL